MNDDCPGPHQTRQGRDYQATVGDFCQIGVHQRRLARWLVGSPIKDIERDLVLETLAKTDGNRAASAPLLGFSIRTLRNKITEYSADGVDVPPPGGLT